MTEKIDAFLRREEVPSPCLVVDLDAVADAYARFRVAFPQAKVLYAMKANPAPAVLARLLALGAGIDVSSRAEIVRCLELGADPAALSYGSTIKKAADVAWAYEQGVRIFAFDAAAELDKLAVHAPGAEVYCRLLVDNDGAAWPLARKFGCDVPMARGLLRAARDRGLAVRGAAVHIGSQQTDAGTWDAAIATVAKLYAELERDGLELIHVNLGGGFPARYRDDAAELEAHATAIEHAMARHFGNRQPAILLEPGRFLVADAGVLQAEVVLVARKSAGDAIRWVYLDVGRFSGLGETEGEAIRYRIATDRDGGAEGPVVIAGPTCDSADILYERADYRLPLDLAVADRVRFLSAGAYTASMASSFNGIDRLREFYI